MSVDQECLAFLHPRYFCLALLLPAQVTYNQVPPFQTVFGKLVATQI